MWRWIFRVRSNFGNQKFSRSYFQVGLSNFWKYLVSNFLVLIGLSICIVISKSFANAFFRDSIMQNLKMLVFQNLCLPLIYLDIEFHQNRLNLYGSQFFQVHKILVLLENFENVYKWSLTVFPRSIDVAIHISSLVNFQKSKNFPGLFFRYGREIFRNSWVQNSLFY